MTVIGRLIEAPTRDAWKDEARDFTPWLAQNLDLLGEAIGLPMEAEGTEVSVSEFSADILARDLEGNLVLIENQLEGTDHRHLGQIMTYLAGLQATTVVWVATGFREAHLSALKWLNDHTVEPFAFFAVKLRVVRIGDSSPAPILDVVVRPNAWERRMQKVVRETTGESGVFAPARREFWGRYLQRYPQDADLGVMVGGGSYNWLTPPEDVGLIVSIYRTQSSVGVFLRGKRGSKAADVQAKIATHAERLRAMIGEDLNLGDERNHPFVFRPTDMADPADVDAAIDWMHERGHSFLRAIHDLFGKPVS
ncbi:MAG: hypothetical protein ACE37J_04990 [Pikeienuella sp.]|uniref:hypothetical protein n=1 Tax=Pikeienuella sp. TaxID=2831957 RepID=UPI00391A7B08